MQESSIHEDQGAEAEISRPENLWLENIDIEKFLVGGLFFGCCFFPNVSADIRIGSLVSRCTFLQLALIRGAVWTQILSSGMLVASNWEGRPIERPRGTRERRPWSPGLDF